MKYYRLIMIALLFGVIALYKGRIGGYDLFSQGDGTAYTAPLDLSMIKEFYPTATRYSTSDADQKITVFADQQEIGWAYNTSPYSDDIIGYSSSVPLLVAYTPQDTLIGIKLLQNVESTDFIKLIEDTGFFTIWNGMSPMQVASSTVDAVSGATTSSAAIIKTLKHSTARYLDQPVITNNSVTPTNYLKYLLVGIVILSGMIHFYFPKQTKRTRVIHLFMVIGVLGFWSGTFLSTYSIHSNVINGIDLSTKFLSALILFLSVVLPLFTNKAFYCSYMCPYGAAQDIVHKYSPKKIAIPKSIRPFLTTLREKVFATLLLLLLTGITFDLTFIEPFSAFLFKTASLPILCLAGIFLLLSLVTPRAWCNYVCPTGYFLELLRKPHKK